MNQPYEALQELEAQARALMVERNENPDEQRMNEGGYYYPAWASEAKELVILRQRLRALGVMT